MEINDLIDRFGLQNLNNISFDDEENIKSFLSSGDPIFLLVIIIKLINEREDVQLVLLDYIKTKNEFNDMTMSVIEFREETIKIINKQSLVINDQSKIIEDLTSSIKIVENQFSLLEAVKKQIDELNSFEGKKPKKRSKPH